MMTLPLQRKIAVALVAAGVTLLGAWYFHTPRRATHPIDAVPADAFVAIDVNVGALRRSGTLTALFGDHDEQSLTEVCGFDPVDQMEDLVFTVPEDSNGTFGVAVQASLTQDQLMGCANQIIKAHGGDPTPDIVMRGSYTVITPLRTSADSTKPPRSVGYHNGSPILVGPRTWLYSMIDAIDDASERDDKSPPSQHGALRTALAEGITPPPVFLLTATAVLEKSVREKLKAELLKEVGTESDPGTAMMLGVLGMASGALGLYEAGADVHAVLSLRCEEEPQCAQVAKLVERVRDEWSHMATLRTFGLGPVLDHLYVDHHGTKLELRTSAASTDVLHWAKLYLDSTKPISATVAGGTEAPVPAPTPDKPSGEVPTQTVRVTVPEGLAPGEPFTVRIPAPIAFGDAAVRVLTPVVTPKVRGSASPRTPP